MAETTYVISVGRDPNALRVEATPDGFGSFATREAAAERLLAMVEGRMESLRASRRHARRIIHKAGSR